jgi:hypothetical protein
MIQFFNPGLIVALIFGYGMGAYISVRNFGLIVDGSVPPEHQGRHMLISMLPFVAYVLLCLLFAFWPNLSLRLAK